MVNTTKKNWFITGISSGLGKALAIAAMQQGHFVMGTFRKQHQVDEFNSKQGTNAQALLLDLSDEKSIKAAVNHITNGAHKIDVLVNNAGVGFIGAIEEASTQEIREVFEANFFGTLTLTQMILPIMRKAKAGHIIQISSHGGIKAFAGFGIYNASKFALEGFSEALAQEVLPLGIKVTLVEPGPFRTEFAAQKLKEAKSIIDDYKETAGSFRNLLKSVHGKQEGDPAKAAQAVLDLVASEDTNLRLPLGKTALKTIGMKIESVRADLEKSRKTAEAVCFNA